MTPKTLHQQTKPRAGEDGPGNGFRFATKGRTLERLAPLLTLATCCDQMIVSVERWTAEGAAVAQEVIIIAHRLSTVRACNYLVFLEEGRLADSGKFEDLTARNETFKNLVELAKL